MDREDGPVVQSSSRYNSKFRTLFLRVNMLSASCTGSIGEVTARVDTVINKVKVRYDLSTFLFEAI